jgi:phage shock protein PspC (stress-responsive transcriptional regulator)
MTTGLVAAAYRTRGPVRRWLAAHDIKRSSDGRLIAGVCAGLATRLPVSVWVVRLVFVVLLFFPISSSLLYAALWLLLPPPGQPGVVPITAVTRSARGASVPSAATTARQPTYGAGSRRIPGTDRG